MFNVLLWIIPMVLFNVCSIGMREYQRISTRSINFAKAIYRITLPYFSTLVILLYSIYSHLFFYSDSLLLLLYS